MSNTAFPPQAGVAGSLVTPAASFDFIPRWLDMEAACYYTSMSKNNLLKLIQSKEIFGTQKGGSKWRIDRFSIDKYFLSDETKLDAIVSRLRSVI